MQHQITTADILHDEVYASLRLETSVQVGQERMPFSVGNQEDTLLRSHALHFVILNDELLLENLDSIQLSCTLCLCKHNLTKVTLTKYSQEIEMVQTNSRTSA